MTDDPAELRAEIARLRALLDDHGIDPDPEPPSPPQYWVLTRAEWQFQRMFAATTRDLVEGHARYVTDVGFWEGDQWLRPGTTLRVRMPNKFTVNNEPSR